MKGFVILLALLSADAFSHEIQSVTQVVSLRRQKETGKQQDISGTFELSRKFDVGVQGTYLERFNIYDKRAGGFVTYRPSEKLSLQARYLIGNGNEILPEKQATLSGYYSLGRGLAPYFYYRDSQYSITRVHTANVGIEIEKIPHVILVPSFMSGKATFQSPAKTENLYNFGLRAIYYREGIYSFSVFGYKGTEASQGIIGKSTVLVDTTTGGASFTWNVLTSLKAEIIIDHTDYDQLNTEFVTSMLNLTWMF